MTIRRLPSDFRVEERPAQGLRLSGAPSAHAVWRLEKESLTTPAAVEHLARALGVRAGSVDYAGLKDKHAVTVQRVSVARAALRGEPAAHLEGRGWRAEFEGWSGEPMAAPMILGNRFTIVVRDLTRQRVAEMDRRAHLLGAGEGALLVVNYFGDQRFGSARHGRGFAGRALVEGDFERALRLLIATPARKDTGRTRAFTRLAAEKWGEWEALAAALPQMPERRAVEALARGAGFKEAFAALPYLLQTMAVEAYQSHLWNETARGCVRAMSPEDSLLRTPDDFGEMLFPPAEAVGEAWRGVCVPVLAKGSRLEPPWGEAAGAALEREGIGVERLRIQGLRRPFFGESARALFVEASAFTMTRAEPDDLAKGGRLKRAVGFDLPRGAYATVVLRALGE